MHNNDGYIKVTAVMQKFFDQAISGNWSYNPENYPDNEVPVTVMANDLLTTYKYGWKTSYYQNTYDAKKDGDETSNNVDQLINEILTTEEEDCDSCKV
jgi:ribonucleoside-diphosphate reductase alpha chain